jgi:hypothetical protein
MGGSDRIGFRATRKILEDMEFLKVMLVEMKAKMDATKETLEKQ